MSHIKMTKIEIITKRKYRIEKKKLVKLEKNKNEIITEKKPVNKLNFEKKKN